MSIFQNVSHIISSFCWRGSAKYGCMKREVDLGVSKSSSESRKRAPLQERLVGKEQS